MTSAGNKSGPVADSTTLRVLLVTRRVSDEGETNEALSRGGFAVQSQIVQEVGSLRQALDQQSWDAVLCGVMPAGLDEAATLALVRRRGLDIPFFVLADGVVGPAGPMIRASARDYLIKEETARLVPALERELRSAALRSERHRLMMASQEASRDWQATFDASGDAICLLDADSCIRRANRAFQSLAGVSDGDIIGRPSGEVLRGIGLPSGCQPWKEARRNCLRAASEFEAGLRVFRLTVDPMVDAHGTFGGAVLVLADITDRVQAERATAESNRRLQETLVELREAQTSLVRQARLNALGQMVGGVAHDFNNVLMPIIGLPQMLLEQPDQLADRERVTAVLRGVIAAANDAREIVRRLREFYQPQSELERRPVNINLLIDRAITMTEPAWKVQAQGEGRSIRIERDFGTVPAIWGQESSLREVVTNLLLNAVDAIAIQGVIRIETAAAGEWVTIRVSDTGSGMTAETMQRLFEPFFTTKGQRGSGLGLAASYGIAKRHGGSIEATSKPGQGSVFTIRLPVAAPVNANGGAAATEPTVGALNEEAKPQPALSVLLVEDDIQTRSLVARYLQHAKCRVKGVGSGEEAIEQLQHERYDVLLTDRAMPGMGGDALARQAKQQAPGMVVVMLTGFGDLMREQSERPAGVDLVLGKPVTGAELLQGMRQAIERRSMGSL